MPLVSAHEIYKSYGARSVLRGISLSLCAGERLGVVGRNGAGKSTLAKILAGVEAPDAGSITGRRGANVLYLAQTPVIEGDPTVRELVMQGLGSYHQALARHRALSDALASGHGAAEMLLAEQARAADDVERLGGWDQEHRVSAMLGHLGIERADAPVSTLSGGELRRAALARVLVARPDLAVLDEPTNHLDAETVLWLEGYLKEEFPGALLLITHDRYLLDRVVARTVEVSDGAVYVYDGGYQCYLEQKAERLAHAARVEQNRQNFLRRELEWLRRQPKARTTKQAARVERAEEAIAQPKLRAERTVQLGVDVVRAGKTVLELDALTLAVPGKTLVSGLDLVIAAGERIGVVGRNGSGKTTLLRSILGEHAPASGRVVIGHNTRIAYFDQQRSTLEEGKTVFENAIGDQTRIELGGAALDPHAFLDRFGFDAHQQRQPVGSLSGGERARVALAAMLRRKANLILLDEPTNDLDVDTLGALEAMLVEYAVTALVITHDRWFLDRVATAILAFEGESKVRLYPGNFQSFLQLRAQAAAELIGAAQEAAESSAAAPRLRARSLRKKPLTFAEERELSGLPDAIERAESRLRELESALSDPARYASDTARIAQLAADHDSVKAELDQLLLRWEELETKKLNA